jgi:hypothetical protein
VSGIFPRPVIYEIDTFVWLQRLTAKYGRRIELSNVPREEWDRLGRLNCDAIWLMGVWRRSPEARRIALSLQDLIAECRRILPGFTEDDIPGSPYSIQDYRVDERLGSIGAARAALAERGLKLILDFVANHVAIDHAWVNDHPEYFIEGNAADLAKSPGNYFEAGHRVIAHGRDPYFPAWTDTAQVNAFSLALRAAAADTLRNIATQCDGVRCDMAMLLLNDVVEKVWGAAAGEKPDTEYWHDIIGAVRQTAPDFLFIAEAYWNREWDLQQLGFDFCYDKRLYDRFLHEDAGSVRVHLSASLSYQNKLLRFLENHDEQRAAAALAPERHKAAAVATATLPGAILYHDGQFDGWKVKLPVQLGRGPMEPRNTDLYEFYGRLRNASKTVKSTAIAWTLATAEGWPGNETQNNLLAWCWEGKQDKFLIVINFAGFPSQGRIKLPWRNLAGKQWRLTDLMGNGSVHCDGNELQTDGFYVALHAWQFYILQLIEKNDA